MKAILLIISVFSAMASASGGRGRLVAQIISGGGMPGPDGYWSRETKIYSSGRIYFSTSGGKAHVEAIVDQQTIARIVAQGETLVESTLVQENPDSPPCMDAPSTTYSVVQASGKVIEVGGVDSCNPMIPANDSEAARQIRGLLKSIK